MTKTNRSILILFILLLLAIAAVAIKPLRTRLILYYEQIQTRLYYMLYPPEKAIFVPLENSEAQISTVVAQTVAAWTPSPVPSLTPTSTLQPNVPTPTLLPTPTPLPSQVYLQGIRYTNQHGAWNYCAPANLTMALNFWGWTGTREDIGSVVKPFGEDKNVMPYELADYVRNYTNLSVLQREGGTITLLKLLIANGFPVLIEKGTYIHETATGKLSWMGHYNVINAYDDSTGEFIVQDSYFKPDYRIIYDVLQSEWRGFNYTFLVVYPPEKETALFQALGEYADEARASQIAAATASDEIVKLQGNEQFFAWFNRGTSLLHQQDYNGAATAYDKAFALYPSLPEDKRPWRMMWYQTGPYQAYYYIARYQDVIELASTTIDVVEKPYIEESFYWRGMAYGAIGNIDNDIDDQRTTLQYHPNFQPSLDELSRLGVSP